MLKHIHIPKTIIDKAQENKLIFFVGAGFSKDFGFPDWNGLVRIMLNKIIEDNPKYRPFLDLLDSQTMSVLEVLEKIKNETRIIRDTIYKEFRYEKNKSTLLEKHKKLLNISSKVITTNYDQLLEKASDGAIQRVVYTNSHLIGQIYNLESFIFKIHGDHEEADNCILLEEDYEKLYKNDNAALSQFESIITNNIIVFIGFSLSDPYVKDLFEYINKLYKGYQEKSYILTVHNEDFSQYNITSLPLETHDDIILFLDQLDGEIEKKKIINKYDEFEIDEDEFKSFILDFNENKRKEAVPLDLNEEEIENKYEKMVCSESFKKEIEVYSSYFPSIDEIMMSPSYMDFDKKIIITSRVRSAYNKVHNQYDNGESIFEATVDKIFKEYSNELAYSKTKLMFYIKILVAWTIIGCDIFNEDKRNLVSV
ncbi:SIR2 family protein [Priestia megaterium]|uniref:SIR2 family protein n=1 Tax=Priestia megaterium TaxID=1404 RepID=UPI0021F415C6|nr:SIR2 family protein [Priestia megaterium]UYP07269.1 SIR2 family protein [Priestia megaterium]